MYLHANSEPNWDNQIKTAGTQTSLCAVDNDLQSHDKQKGGD